MDKNEQLNSSSIDQHLSPSLELKLKQGGLTGLQNLGNTVNLLLINKHEFQFQFLVFHEFCTSMFVEYETIIIVLF